MFLAMGRSRWIGRSTTELSVTDNCRGWAVIVYLLIKAPK